MKITSRFLLAGFISACATSIAYADLNNGQFQEVTDTAGIVTSASPETWGQAVGDFDSDGYPDILIGNHQWTPTNMFHNQGGINFVDQIGNPAMFGDYEILKDSHSVQFADFNNDGQQEIVEVSGASWDNEIWIKDEFGVFQTHASGPDGLGIRYPEWRPGREQQNPSGRRAPMFFDFDEDGDLDLFVAARVAGSTGYSGNSALFRQIPHPTIPDYPFFEFVDETDSDLDILAPSACSQVQMHDLSGDGKLDIICLDYSRLTDVWETSATPPYLRSLRAEIGEELFQRWPYDMAIGDFNGDGRNDVLQTSRGNYAMLAAQVDQRTVMARIPDREGVGFSFLANGNVSFEFGAYTAPPEIFIGSTAWSPPWSTDVGTGLDGSGANRVQLTLSATDPQNIGIASDQSERGAYIGFVNGRWQVMLNLRGVLEPTVHVQAGSITSGLITDLQSVPAGVVPLTQAPLIAGTRLYIGNESGQFDDWTTQSGLNQFQGSCATVVAGDFDNDMDLDAYLGCTGNVGNLANVLFDNQGDGTFTQVTNGGGAEGDFVNLQARLEELGRVDAVMKLDYDRDGCLDLFVTNGFYPRPFSYSGINRLYRNQCSGNGNNWAEVKLVGVESNRDGIGAVVYATTTTPEEKTQMREQGGGTHHHAQDDTTLHFGLAQNDMVTLRVVWPDGQEDLYVDLPVNQVHTLIQGGSPSISIADVTVEENAGNAEFTVSLSSTSTDIVSVVYTTVAGTADEGDDYALTSGTLEFPVGDTTGTILVPITDDTDPEDVEAFTVVLSTPTNAAILDGTATGTIQASDVVAGLPTVSIAGVTVEENAGNAEFSVTLSETSTELVSVDWTTVPGTAGTGDFTAASGTLDFPIGETTGTISVAITDDTDPESTDEDFTVQLSNPTPNATILNGTATGTILGPNDGAQTISIADVAVDEDVGNAVFSVTMSSTSTDLVSVDWTTVTGTADAGDFTAASGTLEFPVGETTGTISVAITDDTDPEGVEAFTVVLSGEVNVTILQGTGTGTIRANDGVTSPECGAPTFDTSTEAGVFLWNDCTDPQQWHARMTAGGGALTAFEGSVSSDQPFDSLQGFSLEASDSLPADFSTPTAGPIVYALNVRNIFTDGFEFHFPAGANTCFDLVSPALPVYIGSNRVETTVPINLSTFGSCLPVDDSVSVADLVVSESIGNATFTVNLSPTPGDTVVVSYATADGTAVAGSDYTQTSGTLNFTESVNQLTVSVPITDDTVAEDTKTFTLELSGASVNSVSAMATILDNDGTSTPVCGAPTFDSSTETGVFLWNDCGDTDQWHVRMTAGGGALIAYQGSVSSDQPFDSLQGFSLEASDSLPADFATPTAGPIAYTLNVRNIYTDGFEFHFPTGANTCFALASPALPVWIGANRVESTAPVNLTTFGACTP